jgi:hypothetical protein
MVPWDSQVEASRGCLSHVQFRSVSRADLRILPVNIRSHRGVSLEEQAAKARAVLIFGSNCRPMKDGLPTTQENRLADCKKWT